MSSRIISLFNDQAKSWLNQRIQPIIDSIDAETVDLAAVREELVRLTEDINSDEVGPGDEPPEEISIDFSKNMVRVPHEHLPNGVIDKSGALMCMCGFAQPRGSNKWMPLEKARAAKKTRRR